MKTTVKVTLKFSILLTTIVIFSALSSCSNQMRYNMIQSNQRQSCYSLPEGQMIACLERFDLTYTQYLQARRVIE